MISEKVEKEGTGVTKHQLEPADKSGGIPPPKLCYVVAIKLLIKLSIKI